MNYDLNIGLNYMSTETTKIKKIFIVLEAIIGLVLIYSVFTLPNPPKTSQAYPLQIALLLIFFTLTGYSFFLHYKDSISRRSKLNQVIPLLIFWLALILALYASGPMFKGILVAKEYTNVNQKAAEQGAELGAKVLLGELSQEAAEQEINNDFSQNTQANSIAKTALGLAQQPTVTTNEATNLAFPTIPVRLNIWTCNITGCSYSNNEYVWTIGTETRLLSSALAVVATLLSIGVANGVRWNRTRRQEEQAA